MVPPGQVPGVPLSVWPPGDVGTYVTVDFTQFGLLATTVRDAATSATSNDVPAEMLQLPRSVSRAVYLFRAASNR